MMPFQFDIACKVFKSAEGERRIGGIVSTDHMDRQEETIIQEGLDFSEFVSKGWFNDNHDSSTPGLVGTPDFVEMRTLGKGRKGWYVEGALLPAGHQRADAIWGLANALQKTDRRLGFSVEGAIVERDADNPSLIRKAKVREIAITRCPVNQNTSLTVLAKSLTAGSAVGNPGTSPGEGFPLRTESLEDDYDEKKKRKKKSRYTKSEAVSLLMRLNKSLTPKMAERIFDYTLRWHPAA